MVRTTKRLICDGAGAGESTSKRSSSCALNIRTSPRVLVSAIKDMKDAQRRAVVEMGFGNILILKTTKVPSSLAYWVLDHFDPRSCELKMDNGRSLHVESDDAALIFGLPRGKRQLDRKRRRAVCPKVLEWKQHIGKDRVSINTLKDKMLAEVDGGVWFKRHFVVLLGACLFENPGNGYVNPQILSNLECMSKLREYDWGDYMVRCLVEWKLKWEGKKTKNFMGPILFIVALYLDRVVFLRRTVPRCYPLIKDWTFGEMLKREKEEKKHGGFGTGHLCDRIEWSGEEFEEDKDAEVLEEELETEKRTATDGESSEAGGAVRLFADKFLSKAKILADTMDDLMSMVRDAPAEIMSDPNVKNMVDKAQDDVSDQLKVLEEAAIKRFAFNKEVAAETDRPDMSGSGHNEPILSLELAQLPVDDDTGAEQVQVPLFQAHNKSTEKEQGKTAQELMEEKTNVCQRHVQWADPLLQAHNKSTEKEEGKTTQELMEEKTNDCQQNVGRAKKDKRRPRTPVKKRPTSSQVVRDADPENKKRRINRGSAKETETHTPTDGGENLIGKGPEEGVDISKVNKNSDILKGKNPIETPHHMVRRKETEKRKTEKLNSPYVRREVALTNGWTESEKRIGYWLMNNADADPMEFLFFTEQYQLSRYHMISLLPSAYVEATVIDIWSIILNQKEKSRSKGSPCRFFASTYLTAFLALDPVKEWSIEKRREKLSKQLDEEISDTKFMELGSIDIFVFPIIHSSHFYMMVYDLKNMSIDIIDNSSAMDTGSLKTKYGDVPGSLSQLFNLFLESKGKIKESKELQNVNIRRLSMPWRDNKNKTDCGVFLMRHMETYFGGGEKNWNSGLRKNNKRQLNLLRIKYCAAILKSDINTLKDKVDTESNLHYQQQCVDGPIDLGPILHNYKPPTV